MKAAFEAFRQQCADLCPPALAKQILALPTPEAISGAIAMIPMVSEVYPDRQGWYIDIDGKCYCDLEQDFEGKWSAYFRDRITGNECFADQAENICLNKPI